MERRRGPRPQEVLVVDDSPDIRELWKDWLTFWGFIVQEARDGAEALRKARLRPPAVVLMDLWMPVLDGLEATRLLKGDPRTAHVPVLAMSAQGAPVAAEQAVRAGCETFMHKPVDPDDLLEQIRKALRTKRPSGA